LQLVVIIHICKH